VPYIISTQLPTTSPAFNYAAEQGWVDKLAGNQIRLTDAGFAAVR
jgi:hypothetical protein